MLLWPMHSERDFNRYLVHENILLTLESNNDFSSHILRFYLRESQNDVPWMDSYGIDPQIFRDFLPFLLQPDNREYPDLCQLPGEKI